MPRDLIAYPEMKVDADGEILLQAAARIQERGLWKGEIDSRPSPHPQCVITALMAVTGGDPDNGLPRLLHRLGFDGSACVAMNWNDQPERTKEQVVARLRACAVQS